MYTRGTDSRGGLSPASEHPECFRQVRDTVYFNISYKMSFCDIFDWNDDAFFSVCRGTQRHRKNTTNGPDRTIK